MCGIFGLIRNTTAAHPEYASAAFVELGKAAVERGRDSSGFALHTYTGNEGPAIAALGLDANKTDVTLGSVRVIKDTVPFEDLWDDDQHLPLLAANRVALGHTRWATQGKRDALGNASPLIVGSLVGTHNGDVNTRSVRGVWALPKPYGATDTEVLYQALSRDRLDRRKVTDVLTHVEGRAALAWLDRTRPDRVYLARAALSPLAVAWDAEGNMYWASNPRWFRDIDALFDGVLGFHSITLVEEGRLLTVSLAGAAPVVEDTRKFTPRCRPSDARLGDMVVWRGFDAADCAADKAQQRHIVAPYVSPWRSSGSSDKVAAWAPAATNSPAGTSTGSGWADYTDGLDEIARSEFSDLDKPTEADADADEEFAWAEDEAIRAVTQWLESGGDTTLQSVLRSASMPSEVEGLMQEFDLSSALAFDRFRDLVLDYIGEEVALG